MLNYKLVKKLHTIIYIPGLGDSHLRGQRLAIQFWQVYGVKTKIFPIIWEDDKPFEEKFQKLLSEIDELAEQGHKVSLVGVSAGASTALAALASRKNKISGLVCVCGKIQNSQTIQEYTYKQNPSFRGSIQKLDKIIPNLSHAEREKILSIHPLKDNVVPLADTIISGSKEKILPTFGHFFSIACAITFGSFGIVSFLKKLANNS